MRPLTGITSTGNVVFTIEIEYHPERAFSLAKCSRSVLRQNVASDLEHLNLRPFPEHGLQGMTLKNSTIMKVVWSLTAHTEGYQQLWEFVSTGGENTEPLVAGSPAYQRMGIASVKRRRRFTETTYQTTPALESSPFNSPSGSQQRSSLPPSHCSGDIDHEAAFGTPEPLHIFKVGDNTGSPPALSLAQSMLPSPCPSDLQRTSDNLGPSDMPSRQEAADDAIQPVKFSKFGSPVYVPSEYPSQHTLVTPIISRPQPSTSCRSGRHPSSSSGSSNSSTKRKRADLNDSLSQPECGGNGSGPHPQRRVAPNGGDDPPPAYDAGGSPILLGPAFPPLKRRRRDREPSAKKEPLEDPAWPSVARVPIYDHFDSSGRPLPLVYEGSGQRWDPIILDLPTPPESDNCPDGLELAYPFYVPQSPIELAGSPQQNENPLATTNCCTLAGESNEGRASRGSHRRSPKKGLTIRRPKFSSTEALTCNREIPRSRPRTSATAKSNGPSRREKRLLRELDAARQRFFEAYQEVVSLHSQLWGQGVTHESQSCAGCCHVG